ncbi:MAG TPA: response regulator [Candidatus Limnocylindrales bacterium]|nr:response regulator [Candidatus Limnocylindrales bacterium]
MSQSLKVLIVEDSENDALLLQLELERAGYNPLCHRVETHRQLESALSEGDWDIVIADYVMPRFNGLEALAMVKEHQLDVPFIVVSGHITDDTAVAAMKAGAHDYVMKDNLARLGSAVERELRETELRHERKRAEKRLAAEHAITRLLAGAESIEQAAAAILEVLLESLGMDVATLWVRDSDHPVLQLSAARYQGRSEAWQRFCERQQGLSFASGAGLPGRAWQERRNIWVSDLAGLEDAQRSELLAQAGLLSGASFPIQSGGAVLGVLELFAARQMNHDPVVDNMILAIGSELGQFIQRQKVEEALRRAHDELEMRVQQRTAELKAANAKLQNSIAERKRLETELLEITEKERRRIGLDLHDDLGQKLSGVALMTKGLELKLTKQKAPEAQDVAKIHTLIHQAMNHASDLAHDLATLEFAQRDLPSALDDLAGRARELFSITCRFKSEDPLPPLEPAVVSQVYKIAQEAVTNAIKHGKAKRVSIGLANGDDKLTLTVQNDGLPFPDLRSHSTGMGLRIMNYRASLIGASLDIRAKGHNGTLVTCSIPLETNKRE